jgi:hypothetical protein
MSITCGYSEWHISFQRDPFSEKRVHFMDTEDSVTWVKRVHRRLGEYIFGLVTANVPSEDKEEFLSELNKIAAQLNDAFTAPKAPQ